MASKSKKLSVAADIFEQTIEGAIRKIPLAEITPSAEQPRQMKDTNIESLAKSLQDDGLLQPIVVTKEVGQFVIIAGERRYRAAKKLGWTEIECRILRKNPKEKYKLAVIENLQRENLNAFEEADAYRKLKSDYNYTDAQLSSIIGKSRSYITEILSIAEIPPQMQEQAKEAGIHSKNLLMQLSLATKKGTGDDFLDSYKTGSITTVKAAKSFNKEKKDATKKAPKAQPSGSSTRVNVSLKWDSETDICLEGQIKGVTNVNFPLEQLESIITAVIYKHLKLNKNN